MSWAAVSVERMYSRYLEGYLILVTSRAVRPRYVAVCPRQSVREGEWLVQFGAVMRVVLMTAESIIGPRGAPMRAVLCKAFGPVWKRGLQNGNALGSPTEGLGSRFKHRS